jgi:hypothetical protein
MHLNVETTLVATPTFRLHLATTIWKMSESFRFNRTKVYHHAISMQLMATVIIDTKLYWLTH